METYSIRLEAFSSINQRKRCGEDGLSAEERDRWKLLRCSLERVLFSCVPKPSDDRREFVRVPIPLRVRYRAGSRVVLEVPPERSRPLLKLQAEVLRIVSPIPARPHQAPGAALLFDAASRERLGLAALLENLVTN